MGEDSCPLNSQYTHSGYGFRSAYLLKSPVCAKSDFLISSKALNAALLFIIALEPNFSIGMGDSKALSKEGEQSLWRLTALTKEATGSKVD
jgi:hypothetical protein